MNKIGTLHTLSTRPGSGCDLAESVTDRIPLARPTLPPISDIAGSLEDAYTQGSVTLGPLVGRLEAEVAALTGTEHAIAVSSCTSGLMLSFAAMAFPPGSEVIVPSFTFAATVLPLIWNNLTPVFVDCLPDTLTIDPKEVESAVTPQTVAICPVAVYGLPADLDSLKDISDRYGIPLIYDSAQALGSRYRDTRVGGYGLCEVFSLSPTKVITAVEGGIVTTNDTELAAGLRMLRDYGKGSDGAQIVKAGQSARMSDLHAAVGLLSLAQASELIAARNRLVSTYRRSCAHFKGCRMQAMPADRSSNHNYFVLFIEPDAKNDRRSTAEALAAAGIQTKRYFYPPAHEQPAFTNRPHRVKGPCTRSITASRAALALPLFAHMSDEQQSRVIDALEQMLG
jgi:dTDP-4-amino-4,6-dideoxygalactose transaminase